MAGNADISEFGSGMNISAVDCTNMTPIITMVSPLVSDRTYVTYCIAMDVVLVSMLIIIGFTGNTLSIAVLNRDRNNMINWLLQALAVVDTLYLFSCFFVQTLWTIHTYTDWIPNTEVFPHIMCYMWPVASIAQTITVWMVMLVTITRYNAMTKPLQTHLQGRDGHTLRRAKICFIVICILAIIYNIPRFFEREVIIQETACNRHIIKLHKTDMRRNRVYFLWYKTIMYFIFRTVGPMLTLIVLNIKLILTLLKMHQSHNDLTRANKHSRNTTFMLVIVVSVFIVCEIPDLILRILVTMYEHRLVELDLTMLRYVNRITNMLLTVNSSVNFLIYCLVGKKFRKILLAMIHRRDNM